MRRRYSKSHTPSSASSKAVEETFQHPDFLSDLLAIENGVRALGSSELVRWVERLKDVELHVIRGEPVPREALRQLIASIHCNTAPAIAEVVAGG